MSRRDLFHLASGALFASQLARPAVPEFPNRSFSILDFGAKPGGADCTTPIRSALEACKAAGGGRVVVPAGEFFTGPIHLLSNTNLHLERGAILKFSTDPKRYLPLVFTRWEGTECMNYSPLIYAFEQTNIGVTGEGTLDGQADSTNWWPWKGNSKFGYKKGGPQQKEARDKLVAMGEKDVPVRDRVFGEGSYLRPMFVQTYRSNNVLIEGVRIINSPMWEIHPVLSRNVTVRNVVIDTHGPNNDGCDPESSRDVLIEGCTFDTGDDCIAIKSGRNGDGRRVAVPCENIVIRGCTMKDGHGAVSIGSEVSGDVRHVLVENCKMDSPNLDRALRLKSNSYRGGVIEDVVFRNCSVGQVAQAVLDIDFFYEEGEGGRFPPVVRNVTMENVSCKQSKRGLYLRGYKTDPIRDVKVLGCRFDHTSDRDLIENVEGLQIKP